jgi:hypothetical protein
VAFSFACFRRDTADHVDRRSLASMSSLTFQSSAIRPLSKPKNFSTRSP